MKKIFFYIIGIFAMAAVLASCSNDVSSSVETENKDLIISIRLDRAEMTRVMGNPDATDNNSQRLDAKINSLSFLVFDENGTLITLHNDTYVDNKTYRFHTTNDANELLILANIPSAIIHEINTKNDLIQNGVLSLEEDYYSAIPMIANTLISITEQEPEFTAQELISLKRLLARIGVKNINVDIPSTDEFTPTEIFVCRANDKHALYDSGAESPWAGSSYSDFMDLQDGSITIKGATGETGVTGSMPVLSSGYDDNITLPVSDESTTWQYFYVFPHTATYPTRMVLKGIYTDSNNNESVVYYPVIMNHVYNSINVGNTTYTDAADYPDDSKLDANKSYLLDLTIKGKGAISPASDAPRGSTVDVNFTVGNYSLASQVSEIQLEQDDRELSFNVTITIVSYKEAKQSTTI